MAPDLNSLPTSRPPTSSGAAIPQRPRRVSLNNMDASRPSPPSPRSPSSSSLQAAATINAGLHRPPSSGSPARHNLGLERRRSSLINNFSINDPSVPAPGEMQLSNGSTSGSPGFRRRSFAFTTTGAHHQRQPSLGELHQELENEQEAQVNRLLHMIRIQQDQLANIQRQQQQQSQPQQQQHDSSSAISEETRVPVPSSTAQTPAITPTIDAFSSSHTRPHSPSRLHFGRPSTLSRQSSSRQSTGGHSSAANSPGLRPQSRGPATSTDDFPSPVLRDECAFYQAETQMLTRENQMLRLRIRELERQIADMNGSPSAGHASMLATQTSSPLATQLPTFTSETIPSVPAEAEPAAKID